MSSGSNLFRTFGRVEAGYAVRHYLTNPMVRLAPDCESYGDANSDDERDDDDDDGEREKENSAPKTRSNEGTDVVHLEIAVGVFNGDGRLSDFVVTRHFKLVINSSFR